MNHWVEKLEKLTDEQREAACSEGDERDIENYLLDNKLSTVASILRAKSEHYRLPSINLSGYHPSREAIGKLSEEQARKLGVLPLFLLKERIYVAMADPDDLRCEDFIRKLTGYPVKPVLADMRALQSSITHEYIASLQETSSEPVEAELEDDDSEIETSEADFQESQSPVVQAVWKVIKEAIRLGASDIHLEPDKNKLYLRYRIDGALHDFPPPSYHAYTGIVSRIKVISGMDIAEKRLPQDGRVSVELEGKGYDLRVSILPNVNGEGVCIRVLDPESANKKLEQIGFDDKLLERYDRVIRQPHGMVLVTGPTGSGKSTTLYATLARIKSREMKIITVEDPVEYKIEGLVQVPIKPDIDYTFGMGLRAILRHDPDIVMLGEIRDLDSAIVAFKAALTGHLLFSTLHTNSAILSISRLIDMGIPHFQIMSALSGVLAQRLVRVLCPLCKERASLTETQLRGLGLDGKLEDYEIHKPVGCSKCQHIGYKGRTAIHEFLEISPEMKRLSAEKINESVIRELAVEQGFKTLRESAVSLLIKGVTSLREVIATTSDD